MYCNLKYKIKIHLRWELTIPVCNGGQDVQFSIGYGNLRIPTSLQKAIYIFDIQERLPLHRLVNALV